MSSSVVETILGGNDLKNAIALLLGSLLLNEWERRTIVA